MAEKKKTRTPRQKRSIEKKQLAIETAKKLFCRDGYHSTTTNQIAEEAGLSIGTIYSYFEDKEAILMEMLEQYKADFFRAFDFMGEAENESLFRQDPRKWLRVMIENIISFNKGQGDFNRELRALYFSIPAVTEEMDAQREMLRLGILELLKANESEVYFTDANTASVIINDALSALVDRIVIYGCADEQRLIDMGIEALCRIAFE